MLKWFLRRQIGAFERTWNYDASYIREMIDADPRAVMAFAKVQGLGRYRKDVPLAAHRAAGIVAAPQSCPRIKAEDVDSSPHLANRPNLRGTPTR